ncbi:MAG: SCO6745 family protein [Acidimicrobiales bacterium]
MTLETTARRMWQRLEPYHAVLYFAPECLGALKEAGLKGFYMGYFAARSAPMGEVTADVVVSTFFNFAPVVVRRAIPDAWSFSSVDEVLAARMSGVDAALRRVLGEAVASPEMTEAAALATEAVAGAASAELPARPLFAGNAALTLGADLPPHLQLWLATTSLREHRGDGHVACLLHSGLDGCEALVTAAASGSVPRPMLQGTRAWTDDEWEAAVSRLCQRDWVTPEGEFTEHGRRARAAIEADTDRLATTPYRVLGDERSNRLADLVAPWSKAIVDSGTVPAVNPIGAKLA